MDLEAFPSASPVFLRVSASLCVGVLESPPRVAAAVVAAAAAAAAGSWQLGRVGLRFGRG